MLLELTGWRPDYSALAGGGGGGGWPGLNRSNSSSNSSSSFPGGGGGGGGSTTGSPATPTTPPTPTAAAPGNPSLAASIGVYPGYAGGAAVTGTVSVSFDVAENTTLFTVLLMGLEPNATGGVHIHNGTRCASTALALP